jgi:inorganic phosphate transporter, PiT family
VEVVAAIALAVLFLAYSNGANDNFKGVATLFGSGTCRFRTALIWATTTTLTGSLLALAFAQGLLDTFKGKGLVPDPVTTQPRFLIAVSLGAALTVFLATRLGLPVSTTHALTGGLIGAGLLASDGEVRFAALGRLFVVPLLFSPVASLLLAIAIYPAARAVRRMAGVTTGPVLDAVHYLSAGAVGFARGLNDTPKMVAILLAGEAIDPTAGLFAVALAMAIGGVLGARRVAETMSRKITRMTPGQGLTANLVTAFLVTAASRFGLPVSTTHVAVGALFGIGLVNGTARWQTALTILLAWVTTLPLGAALAATVFAVVRLAG